MPVTTTAGSTADGRRPVRRRAAIFSADGGMNVEMLHEMAGAA
ncbi:MAG: hypothetical protein ACJ768_22555 [Gaiellaceae bacterium]